MPRSGQHFLSRALKYYTHKLDIKNHYCVYYGECKTIPCNCNIPDDIDIVFQKNHDFDCAIKTDILGVKYIYLFRDSIINCVEANRRLKEFIKEEKLKNVRHPDARGLEAGSLDKTSNIDIKYDDTEFKNFQLYFDDLATKLLKIKEKWLKVETTSIVIYEELIRNFEYNFTKILTDIDIPINTELIQDTKMYCNPSMVNKKKFTTEQINILNNLLNKRMNKAGKKNKKGAVAAR